jgi:flagellar biosynthetic protein FliR
VQILNEELLLMWFLASVRATGLLTFSPVFSSRTVPAPLRVIIGFFLAFVVASLQGRGLPLPQSIGGVVVAMVQELLIGFLMGWAVRLTLNSVEVASQIISSELGFTMGQQIDPMSDTSESAIGQLLMSFGAIAFFVSNAHQSVLGAFLRSFSVAPIGMLQGNIQAGQRLVEATGKIFHIGLQIAAPLIAVNFVVSFTFSILGKAAPSMNVFGESFAVRIIAGLTVLGITLGLAAQVLMETFRNAPESMLRLVP